MDMDTIKKGEFIHFEAKRVDEAILSIEEDGVDKQTLLKKQSISDVITTLMHQKAYQSCTRFIAICLERSISFKWALQSVQTYYGDYMSEDDQIAYDLIEKLYLQSQAIDPEMIKHLLSELDLHLVLKWLLIAVCQLFNVSTDHDGLDTGYIVNLVMTELAELAEDQESYYNNVIINGIYFALGDVNRHKEGG